MTVESPGVELPAPRPTIDDLDRPFWDAAAERRLTVQYCGHCDRHQHVPLALCPTCSGPLDWREVTGRGVIHTFTIVHLAHHPALADKVPYNVSVVELDEGPLLVTNVVNCSNAELEVGMPVTVVFEDIGDGLRLPKFEPANASG
jgi:uncharacterized OB-fold protein